ncbi:MAG: hypothetical protein JNM56_30545 [Planctomycetia bacterium]|nr:hypothetical protein [Planctomycetia bacterium]
MAAPTSDWLRARWDRLVASLGANSAEARRAFDDLAARYSHRDRHYHNLNHLRHVLETIDRLAPLAHNLRAVLLAAWFHDAVYDARAADNEERSAALAREVLDQLGVPKPLGERVAELILLTKTHSAGSEDIDGQILLDADLAILGAPAERYLVYAAAIRREYAWVPDSAYRPGRGAVLRRFLERPAIYRTPPIQEALEAAARLNLEAEHDSLIRGAPLPATHAVGGTECRSESGKEGDEHGPKTRT